jgi:hypothetical protein
MDICAIAVGCLLASVQSIKLVFNLTQRPQPKLNILNKQYCGTASSHFKAPHAFRASTFPTAFFLSRTKSFHVF